MFCLYCRSRRLRLAALDKYEAAVKFAEDGKGEWDDSSSEDEESQPANDGVNRNEALVSFHMHCLYLVQL